MGEQVEFSPRSGIATATPQNVAPVAGGSAQGAGHALTSAKTHLLTVALEDYFHNFDIVVDRGQWHRFERRLERSTQSALDLLDEFGVRATFFTLGWTADHLPEVVNRVAARGHEIASKGYHQRSLRDLSVDEFRDDLARAKEAIEAATGQRVLGYRAPGWLRAADRWALRVLAEEGYLYDSSVKPLFIASDPELGNRFVHRIDFDGRTLWEIPISTTEIGGLLIPVGAGNYFRQLPSSLMQQVVATWTRRYDAPFVMYFHTWELDPEQPHITAAPLLFRIRRYRNLERVPANLRYYLAHYAFTAIRDLLGATASPSVERRPASSPPLSRAVARPRQSTNPATQLAPVSIVVPCFNEQYSLPYLANALDELEQSLDRRYAIEYVFVDDASTDRTWELLQRLFGERRDCVLLHHETNRGVAASILTGIRGASSPVVCSIDCDCTYDPAELTAMIPLLTPDVDLVTASPYHPKGRVNNVPGWRLALSKTLSMMYRVVLRQPLHTFTSCCRVYRRSAVCDLELKHAGFLGVAELLGVLAVNNARIVEHPATLNVRVLGYSKMRIARTIAGHMRLLGSLSMQRLASTRRRAGAERNRE